jgi:micrococcal nuclease
MKKKRVHIYIYLTIFFLLLITGALFYFIFFPAEKSEIKDMTVVNVIDGDTFEYYDAGAKTIKTVRLLCVDTPEQGEEGYEQARDFLSELILGERIILEKDISETDAYGRLLRYVYLENGEFVNELIIKNGYGTLLVIPPETCEKVK